jgi:hypothetical protein
MNRKFNNSLEGGQLIRKLVWIALLLLVLLLLVSCGSKDRQVEPFSIDKSVVEVNYELFDMSADKDGNIYIADKDRILVLDSDMKKKTDINEDLMFCCSLGIDESKIYAIDAAENLLITYNHKGEMIEKSSIQIDGFPIKMDVIGSKIIVLMGDYNYHNRFFINTYDKSSLECRRIDIDNVVSFSKYNDNNILIKTDHQDLSTNDIKELVLYNVLDDEVAEEFSFNARAEDFEYSQNDNKVYFIYGDSLKQVTLGSDKVSVVYRINSGTFEKIEMIDGNCLVTDSEGLIHKINNIGSFAIEEKTSINVLTYTPNMDKDELLKKALTVFLEINEDASVNFEYVNINEYYDKLSKKFMAGDSDFDIFKLDNGDTSYSYLKNQVMADLSSYTEINNCFDKMYEGIKRNCMVDGNLVGIPWEIKVHTWKLNEGLFNTMKIDFPKDDWSLDDFYSFVKEAKEKKGVYALQFRNARFIIFSLVDIYNDIYVDYLAGKVEYNNSDFIELLELGKKLLDEDLILLDNNKASNVLFYEEDMKIDSQQGYFISAPSISGECRLGVSMVFLCINRNSENKDLSAKFLATIISEEVQNDRAINKRISLYKPTDKQTDTDSVSTYERLLAKSVRRESVSKLKLFIAETFEKYIKGEISVQQAAKLIDDKAKIIVGE